MRIPLGADIYPKALGDALGKKVRGPGLMVPDLLIPTIISPVIPKMWRVESLVPSESNTFVIFENYKKYVCRKTKNDIELHKVKCGSPHTQIPSFEPNSSRIPTVQTFVCAFSHLLRLCTNMYTYEDEFLFEMESKHTYFLQHALFTKRYVMNTFLCLAFCSMSWL